MRLSRTSWQRGANEWYYAHVGDEAGPRGSPRRKLTGERLLPDLQPLVQGLARLAPGLVEPPHDPVPPRREAAHPLPGLVPAPHGVAPQALDPVRRDL
jgi:hypothetical protein